MFRRSPVAKQAVNFRESGKGRVVLRRDEFGTIRSNFLAAAT